MYSASLWLLVKLLKQLNLQLTSCMSDKCSLLKELNLQFNTISVLTGEVLLLGKLLTDKYVHENCIHL
jgi:hypothetical protein